MARFGMTNLFALVVTIFACNAVADGQRGPVTLDYAVRLSGEVYHFFMQADGNYYLADNWVEGDVELVTGEKVHGELLKYNTYLDELIWLSSRTYQPVKADKKLVSQFSLALPGVAEAALFRNITISVPLEADSVNLYAQQLYEGNISLVAHRRVVISGERQESYRGGMQSIPRLTADPVFYIVTGDHEAFEVSRFSRRSLYRIFPDYRSEIRAALRNEGLLIRSEADLIRAVSIIDDIVGHYEWSQ